MPKRPAGLTRIGADLKETLRALGIEGPAREAMAIGLWSEVVGETIAAATLAVGIHGGILEVRARSSAWAQELSFHKRSILRRLNERLGGAVVTDFRCHVGAVASASRVEEPAPIPHEEIAGMPVPDDVEQRIAAAAQHPDAEIAALVRRALTHEWQLDEWRRRHGYRPCAGCGALCEPDRPRCPGCVARRRGR